MNKLLYIKVNPKDDKDSNTLTISDAFVCEYLKNNPNDEIVILDLYKEGITHLNKDIVNDMMNNENNNIAKEHAELFKSCNKYVVSAPMWNFSIPSILKSYLDYIIYRGITFEYSENGPKGLLNNIERKCMHIVTRGSSYDGELSKYKMDEKYLKLIFSFIGIDNFQTLALEKTSILPPEELKIQRDITIDKARIIAEKF